MNLDEELDIELELYDNLKTNRTYVRTRVGDYYIAINLKACMDPFKHRGISNYRQIKDEELLSYLDELYDRLITRT